jgi:YD repeat-containing protein
MLLAGCAMSASMPRPADFPFHVAAPPVDIHWRLSLQGDVARAEGLIVRRQPYVASAWLQLLGLDASGRIVSFTPPTWVRWRSSWDSESFTITLRSRGTEERFEVRLHSFEYVEEISP